METKRDWLDYVDLIVKIVGGGILVAVLSVINHNNDLKQKEIDNSLRFGEFTKSMIQEIIIEDSTHFQQDLALITLNHAIGKSDPQFISDLGTRIIEKFLTGKANRNLDGMQSILKIVQQKDTLAYRNLILKINAYNERLVNNVVSSTVSKGAKDTSNIASKFSEIDLDKINLLPAKATVFIQINSNDENIRSKAAELQNGLKSIGFNAPGVEAITKAKFQNEIRYFYTSDIEVAKQVQAYVQNSLKSPVKLTRLTKYNTRSGQIELWINY
jgi:hypothetical protein